MQSIIFIVSCLAIVGVSADQLVESSDGIDARALKFGPTTGRKGIAAKVQCVTDTIDGVVNEYQCQPVWRNVEQQLQTSIGNLFLCLKYQGFQVQTCVAREVFNTGLSMNNLLTKLDSDYPEAGKQVRLRITRNCCG
ncbi:uncharacterized protein LOC116348352 [Contarinia nasturtii]|uniref:uncharacterized protein LOC116348352 n=1 Tax=Contarinia nasturtii TaxID=265458 RepID=UPI0012D49535|nr:uncharacterized protein LOC116348352 [Contarinia nasturtii]